MNALSLFLSFDAKIHNKFFSDVLINFELGNFAFLGPDYAAFAVVGKVGPVKPVKHTSWV